VSDLYDRANAEEGVAAELRRFRELETEEETAFHELLSTRPASKASVIACVKHVADCGLASDEMRAWLAMIVESPLAS
jgi:ribosomal protein L7/L12